MRSKTFSGERVKKRLAESRVDSLKNDLVSAKRKRGRKDKHCKRNIRLVLKNLPRYINNLRCRSSWVQPPVWVPNWWNEWEPRETLTEKWVSGMFGTQQNEEVFRIPPSSMLVSKSLLLWIWFFVGSKWELKLIFTTDQRSLADKFQGLAMIGSHILLPSLMRCSLSKTINGGVGWFTISTMTATTMMMKAIIFSPKFRWVSQTFVEIQFASHHHKTLVYAKMLF